MSDVVFLRGPAFGKSNKFSFTDVKKRLELAIDDANSSDALTALIEEVKSLTKDSRLSADQHEEMKRVRQRVYDRKRILKSIEVEGDGAESSVKEAVSVRPLIAIGFVATAALAVAALVWHQSVSLYQSGHFSAPMLTAFAAIAMTCGFAAFHALKGTKLALLMCIYAIGYEGYFMVQGTLHDERASLSSTVVSDPNVALLTEKVARAQSTYASVKAKLEDPASKVFNNDWFRKRYVDPAFANLETANAELSAHKATLAAATDFNAQSALKIMFRLGLVILCMMLVHAAASSGSRLFWVETR